MSAFIKFTIIQYINNDLNLIGGEKITNYMQLMKWILSEQAIMHLPVLWMALNGHWDEKNNIFLIVDYIKCRYGIDFLKYKEGYCLTRMAKHSLRQIRKSIANAMDKEYGLALQKSSLEHKQEGKSWNRKRKLGEWHDKYIFWRHGNASKNKFNNYCDSKKGLEKHKVSIDKVDTSLKKEPSMNIL